MGLTIIDRPQGHVLDTTPQTATVTSSSGALFTNAGHGLVDGDYIFIDSDLSAYNGYWYVAVNSVDEFQLRPYATASAVQAFVNSGTVTYYKSVLAHNWSAVHLPIVYKIVSSLWPTNTDDTARTVSSITNDSGYVNLNLSGDIKATGSAAELEFVKITGQNAGIYQIVNYVSDSDITIDYPYDSSVTFAGSQVQYYYNDYHARINIYAGLPDSHAWNAQKPYELIGNFKFVPDQDGIITVNIADYIKSKISIDTNDTTLDTLPNDINSFCSFYIEYAEAYTYSNGYSLGTSVGSYTSDKSTFEGFAINAQLPFQTTSSGYMSEYVSGLTANTRQKFLTNFQQPEICDGQYFDLSFILNSNSSGFYILEQYVSNDVVMSTVSTSIPYNDLGVYRFQVTYNGAYDNVRVTLFDSSNTQLSETKEIIINPNCSNNYTDLCWKNYLGGHDYWRFNAGKQKSLTVKKGETSVSIYPQWPKSYGKFAQTVRKNSMVSGSKAFLIRSQYITPQQAEDISGIHYSLLTQEVTSETQKRTILIDDGSFNIAEETDKLVEVSFKMRYTDELPVQKL